MTPEEANAEALRRIRHCRETGDDLLDLGDLGLEELPEELGTLTHLRTLALGRWKPTHTEAGAEWKYDLSRPKPQYHDVSGLVSLTNLKSLNLSFCDALQDVSVLAELAILDSLDLSYCRALQGVSGLVGLTNLKSLNLAFCGALRDISSLAKLSNLNSLDLSDCDALQDVSVLVRLTNLNSLTLSGCDALRDVSGLAELTNLNSLDLGYCRTLQDVHGLEGLRNLNSLNLRKCKSVRDVSGLEGMTNLSSLDLGGCVALQDVAGLAGLVHLKSLDLSNCGQLSFARLRGLLDASLSVLRLHGTPWTDLPVAVCGNSSADNCVESVRAYYADLDAGAVEDAEVMAFILGNGRIGKTQLSRRLTGDSYDPSVETTHGVRLVPTTLDVPGFDYPFRLNLWDFGGQELYHGSHALFLRGQGVFLLLWTPETESGTCEEAGLTLANHPLDYWLDYLREMVGVRDCDGNLVVHHPVLLIQSRCESKAEERRPTLLPDAGEFPNLYTLTFSARTNRGLGGLHEALQEAVATMYTRRKQPMMGIGRSRVRESIRTMQQAGTPKTLTVTEFEVECQKAGNVSSPRELLTYLHRTGVVFHSAGLFDGQIIVDQSWALEAIYTIFTRQEELQRSIISRRGRFTRDDLDRYVWKGKFNIEEQSLFLSMMEQCHICFQVQEGEYIAPEKLEPWTQEHAANFAFLLNRPADAAVVAEYHFLHIGIVRSFLAKIGHEAQDRGEFWRYGCCFYERNTGSRALIQCHPGRPADGEPAGTISLQTWGTHARELLASLVTMLNRMPLGQRPVITWTAGDSPPPDTDEDRARFQRHITLPRQVFLSYRHGDSADLVHDLADVLRREGWEVVWDQTHLAHGDSISTFVDQVRLIPFLISVWSRTYHDSHWCLSELFGWLEGQQCRFERLDERAIGLILDDVGIDQPEQRIDHTTRLRTWCQGRARRADSQAPRDLELLQLMQAWHPRFSNVLERLSDPLLPRGETALRQDNFRVIVQRLNAQYDTATQRQ